MGSTKYFGLPSTASITVAGITVSGLTASLPVFSGSGKALESKSIADTKTALGIVTNAIAGSSTGHQIRSFCLVIQDGTNADTIKCKIRGSDDTYGYNQTTYGPTDNITLGGGKTGQFTLSNSGETLTVDPGVTAVGVIGISFIYNGNNLTKPFFTTAIASGGSISMSFSTTTGGTLDLRTINTGEIAVQISYISSN